ncbi:MAG: hypothetical protein NEA02_10735 [Thermoanaerobaculia bacterium]|nr:hypothetical protein [Thermoanaerobaculia bacterium]
MSLPDFLLEASRVLIGLGLSVFVGVPLVWLVGRMTRGEGEEEKERDFLEGGEDAPAPPERSLPLPFLSKSSSSSSSSPALGRARFVAAGGLLLGVLLEVQVMGSGLPPRHVWRAGVLFLLIASLVSSVMIVRPWERYYREKSLAFEENSRQPWVSRADAARSRAARIDLFGFLAALAAVVLG